MKAQVNKKVDFIDELASMLPPERTEKAKREAGKEIFQIRLAELRTKMGVRQEDMKAFTQSSISKLEARKDVKLSTLIEYLESIGMGMEIIAYPKKPTKNNFEAITLLKV